jgi:predicted metal-binding membrane protein
MLTARGRPATGSQDLLICGVVAVAWMLALLLPLLGQTELLSHDAVLAGPTPPSIPALLLFLVAWQVMTGAMMLPSSLPLVGLFARASRSQARPGLAMTAFLAAYFAVWTGFAILALLGDAGLHRLVTHWSWLADRPWMIAGSVLLLAGAFQFSPLKERCLDACRTPLNFLYRYYQQGIGAAWTLGLHHGVFCLGCCWALMLTMFAVGVGSLAWMAGLTGVMVIEKTARHGRQVAPLVGAALLLWGFLMLTQPSWLPAAIAGR